MSAEDITVGGRRPGSRPLGSLPGERPTARIDCQRQGTRPYAAPRAIGIAEAKELAAEILSGSAGLMRVGRPGIEELAWLVVRLDPGTVVDPTDDTATMDIAMDPDSVWSKRRVLP